MYVPVLYLGKVGLLFLGKGSVLYLGFTAHRKDGCTVHTPVREGYCTVCQLGGVGGVAPGTRGYTVPVRFGYIVPGKDG